MRVLFIVPRFHPYPGGYERYILGLARRLMAEGNSVLVLTTNAFDLEYFWLPDQRGLPMGTEVFEGIEIRRFQICHAKWRRRWTRLLGFLPSWRLQAQFRRPSFRIIGLAKALGTEKPDVIHIGPLPYAHLMYFGVRERLRRGVHLLCTPCTHFGEAGSDDVLRHYTQPHQIELLKQCDTVLALTEMERNRLIALGLPADKVFHTGAGIDIAANTGGNAAAARARYGLDNLIVLHLGTKAPDKGSPTVLDAMHLLWARGIRAHLVMAGSSVGEFELYAAKKRHELFVCLGPISDQEKRDLLSAAAIVVQPSRVESFGMIYLEALENEKALIVADTPASREIIRNDEDGVLVPFGDSLALANTIEELIVNDSKRERLGRTGQAQVRRRFDWDRAVERILKHFYQGCSTQVRDEVLM